MKQAIRSKKIRESAKGEQCTFVGSTCNHDTKTTVFCHLDRTYAGKGMRIKSDDIFGFYACSNCHIRSSKFRETTVENLLIAMVRTQKRLIEKGLVIVVK